RTDLDGIVTRWNPAAERVYGYSASEAIGEPNRLIIPADRYAEDQQVRDRIAAAKAVVPYESVRVRNDGVRIDVFLTVSPIRAADGTIVGVSKIARDISERKRADAERIRLKDDAIRSACPRPIPRREVVHRRPADRARPDAGRADARGGGIGTAVHGRRFSIRTGAGVSCGARGRQRS